MDAIKMPPQEEAALLDAFARLKAVARAAPNPSLETRKSWLNALERLIQENRQALVDAVNQDFGQRSSVETRLAELFPSLEGIRHARRHLKSWMRPRRRGVSLWFAPARASVHPQPLGVVGVVVPWNYPLFLAFGPITAALAAGNRVMVKMSEYTPATGELLQRLARQHFGDDLLAVVNGGPELAQAFVRLPFDHLLFTGSTSVGRHVMRAAAEGLTPVTLELGGKSPALVARGANLRRAAEAIVAGKMMNAGQTCVAPDYLLVNDKDCALLLDEIRAAAKRAYPTLARNPDYSAIVNDRHYQRLRGWLEGARQAGARIDEINPASEDLAAVRKLPLTLVQRCPGDCALMQEEIFGPILPVVAYDKFDEALAYINARPRPLALYLFDDDPLRIDRVLQETISGGVSINDTLLHVVQEDLPFGGVGPSGMGHYHGREGFLTFSKLKPVFRQSRLSGAWLTRPPYGTAVEWLLKLMLR
ncbi:coniferyl aldehyde dehydrogenase [Chromobacterium violaceum]|uniref:coniferyl aldehyde dehydrogenase n=1 Tax=Chromobacterium violaceum TaxID=536 RepID=UPI000C127823|nr:coniferyl aldehyde dehydrogenase [Chromobacterium violaceum]ATP28939.1 coniferyl aldehyde dehydrogenase [Chromobacterium violaceum]ATP32850.1 coniferyl aldehyde dehydrogenase [Chromobacterium violaceum]